MLNGCLHGIRGEHLQHLGPHDAAGRVFRVPQKALDAGGFVGFDGAKNLVSHRLRKIGNEIRRIVGLKLTDNGGELFGTQEREYLFARRFPKLRENISCNVRRQQPHQVFLPVRINVLNQIGDVGRVQVGKDIQQTDPGILMDQLADVAQQFFVHFNGPKTARHSSISLTVDSGLDDWVRLLRHLFSG